jgi:hypothetical protein
MEQDLKRMDDILNRDRPSYPFDDIHLTLDFLKAYSFSAGDAFCKAILCLYAYFEPKSFASNSLVNLDNSWLRPCR